MTQKLTNTMFTGTLASSKLTGAFGSNDGSALTGLGGSGATISASNPTILTNPAGGAGTLWSNSTTGDLFVCTDATAGANIWANVGGGLGNYGKAFGGRGPGTIAGFAAGGINPSGSNVIDKFLFSSNTTATDHGDLSVVRGIMGGQSSNTHGYTSGGGNTPENGGYAFTIDKFSFATAGNATDHGDLTIARHGTAANSSTTDGYNSGGYISTPTESNTIDKFSFASAGNATDQGDLTVARYACSACSSSTDGYNAGGGPFYNTIDKFSFASTGNATDHGDLTTTGRGFAAASSETHGYGAGGYIASTSINVIQRYAFGSNNNASDVGDITTARYSVSGHSASTHGYASGGASSGTLINRIDKYAHAASSTATDHGDLSVSRRECAGTQY